MNAVIMEDTHLHDDEHDLKGHERSYKVHLDKIFYSKFYKILILINENAIFS